eukprot:m.467603 g.467603  ORF g.467603 m.467603 type:complete len:111 (-) comp20366_c0_seq4:97-429(-)
MLAPPVRCTAGDARMASPARRATTDIAISECDPETLRYRCRRCSYYHSATAFYDGLDPQCTVRATGAACAVLVVCCVAWVLHVLAASQLLGGRSGTVVAQQLISSHRTLR